jgi:2'-5' RNA ligase
MRLFIASSFPDAVSRDLNDRVAKLKPRLPPASWVKPETQHVTFAFLGEQPPQLVDVITPQLETAMSSIRAFDAAVAGSGFFPNARRARVGWVGLKPEGLFRVIADAVREIVTRAGVSLDRAEFRAHLTLLRMRDPWPPASTHLFETALHDYTSPAFKLDRITLYSSKLDPGGAVHTPLHEFKLA